MESRHSILNYAVMYEEKKTIFRNINTVFPDLKYIQKIVMHVQETVNFSLRYKYVIDGTHLGTFTDRF